MPSFKDKLGRDWEVAVNVVIAQRVKDVCGIPILKLLHVDVLPQVFEDLPKMVDVLYVLCEKQCAARKMTDIEFAEALTGDCLDDASKCLMDAVALFFPKRERERQQRIISLGLQASETLYQIENQSLDKFEQTLISSASVTS